jgi:hypothetical protein
VAVSVLVVDGAVAWSVEVVDPVVAVTSGVVGAVVPGGTVAGALPVGTPVVVVDWPGIVEGVVGVVAVLGIVAGGCCADEVGAVCALATAARAAMVEQASVRRSISIS